MLIGMVPDQLVPHSLALAEGPLGLRMLPYPIEGFSDMLGAWQRVETYRASAPSVGTAQVYVIEYANVEDATGAFGAVAARLGQMWPDKISQRLETLDLLEGTQPRHSIRREGDFIYWSTYPR
jgi:hypothetical protein